MNQQQKTAAEIEAETDAKHRPAAPADEVRCLSSRVDDILKRLESLQFQINQAGHAPTIANRLKDLEDFTGIYEDGAEPLQEAIDTNAEHIGEILNQHARRISNLEEDEDAPNLDQLRPLYAVLHSMFGS